MDAIAKLANRGSPPALILTIHRKNGLKKHRQRLKIWLKEMEDLGVRHIRLHTLEIETEELGNTLGLSPDESMEFMLDMWEFGESELKYIQFDIFGDIFKTQTGRDGSSTCTFQACDPWTTHAVQGIDGQGNQNNCGRTNKEGIDWLKASDDGYERNVSLYHTPQEYGGCQGCRFWALCKGYCPGTALDGDWRNRTLECEQLKTMFGIAEELMEKQGEVPFSKRKDLKEIEETMLAVMMQGAVISSQNANWLLYGDKGVDNYAREYKFKGKYRGYLNKNLMELTKEQLLDLQSFAKHARVDISQIIPDYKKRLSNAK
jgi:uncharacterized protein